MKKNVFVVGLDELNLEKMKTLRQVREGSVRIHQLLTYEETHGAAEYPIVEMLQNAVRVLNDFPGRIDAITGFWDFPVSCMTPILCAKYGLPNASLESVLKCEDKYWSRVEQKKAIPDNIPAFQSFDPFDDEALSKLDLKYPFWIKPIKSFGSALGFRIGSKADWDHAIPQIRGHIGTFTEPLDRVMELADVPPEVAENEDLCLAEQIISGRQCTLEGYVYNGKTRIYGVVDSIRYAHVPSFFRFQYPSKLPRRAQKKMSDITRRLLEHIGYDNRTFNAEFFYDTKRDQPWLIEVNTRMAQSHADLFYKVDGASNHEIMVDLAVSKEPEFPRDEGEYGCAGKFFVREFQDGFVTQVPDDEKVAEVERAHPGLIVQPMVTEGMRLSQLLYQDSYSYYLAILYLGGKNEQDLMKRYRQCIEGLEFRVSGPEEQDRILPHPDFKAEEQPAVAAEE